MTATVIGKYNFLAIIFSASNKFFSVLRHVKLREEEEIFIRDCYKSTQKHIDDFDDCMNDAISKELGCNVKGAFITFF